MVVRPRRADRLPDAFHAVLRFELVGAVGVVAAHEDVLRQVDVQALDRVEAERDVAVHPHLAHRHRHLLVLDGVDEFGHALDCCLAVHRVGVADACR